MKTILYPLFSLIAFTTQAQSYDLKLSLSGNSYTDAMQVQFISGATAGFDSTYDSQKAFSVNASAPQIFSAISGPTYLSINSLPFSCLDTTIDVKLVIGAAGAYTFSAFEPAAFPKGQCIMLEDIVNNVYHDLRNGTPIAVNLNTTLSTDPAQFRIHFKSTATVATDSTSCFGTSNGAARINGAGWAYVMTDMNNNLVKSNPMLSTQTDTAANLAAGQYIITLTTVHGWSWKDTVSVGQPGQILPSFTSPDTVFLCNGGGFTATNTSQNATRYLWDFGDAGNSMTNTTSQFMVNGTHNYSGDTVGNYTVVLYAMKGHCINTFSKTIHVSSTHRMEHFNRPYAEVTAPAPLITGKGRELLISSPTGETFPMVTTIYNMAGQQLAVFTGSGSTEYTLSVQNLPTNALIIQVVSNTTQSTRKMVLTSN